MNQQFPSYVPTQWSRSELIEELGRVEQTISLLEDPEASQHRTAESIKASLMYAKISREVILKKLNNG